MQPARSTCTDWAGASFRQLREVEKMRLQGHKKTSGKEPEQLAVGREGGCRGDNAACAPGRFDGHEGGRSHGQGLEHRHTAHAEHACTRESGLQKSNRARSGKGRATRQGLFAGAGSMARRPDVTTAPGYHRRWPTSLCPYASALPKPLACPHI